MTETAPEQTYSIAQAATAIGKSQSQVKAYKKLVLSAFKKNTSLVQSPNGSLTEQGLAQLIMAAKFYAKSDHDSYRKAVFQNYPDLEYCLDSDQQTNAPNPQQVTVRSGGSLVPIRETNQAAQLVTFDKTSAAGQISALRQQGMASAQQLGGIFSAYAQTRVQQAFHEIDATVEAYKVNALLDMGMVSADATSNVDGVVESTEAPKQQP